MPRRENYLKLRKRGKRARRRFIHGPRQAADRRPAEFVSDFLSEVDLVFDEGTADLKPRSPIGDAHELAAFAPEGRREIKEFVIPRGGRSLGVDRRDPS